MIRRLILCAALLLPHTVHCQQWGLYPNVRALDFWSNPGLDLTVSCGIGGTTLSACAGAGWEYASFYGNEAASSYYRRFDAQGFVGVDHQVGDVLDVFAFAKERCDRHYAWEPGGDAGVFHSGLPDRRGIQQTSFLAGIGLGGINFDWAGGTRSGLKAAVAWEIAPRALNDVADFQRIDVNLTGFLPIVSSRSLTLCLADRAACDYLFGGHVPLNARQSSCGWAMWPAMQMPFLRGTDPGRFDGCLKLTNNFDLRMSFPSLGFGGAVPGVTVLCDCGVCDQQAARVILGAGPTVRFRHLSFDLTLGLYGAVCLTDGDFSVLVMLSDYF